MEAATEPAPAPAATLSAPRDVVLILSYTSWSGAVRRAHIHSEDRLTLHLLGSERVGRLLVCNPFRSAPAKLARSALGPRDAPFPASATRRLHEPLRLRRSDPTAIAAVERSCLAYERGVRRAAAGLGMERPAVIVVHPLIAGFARFDWAGTVTHYAFDDMAAWAPLAPWQPSIDASFERLRAAGHRVVGVTPAALGRVGGRGPTELIPNGIEPAEWLAPGPAPKWFEALPSPRLLYVGTLDERVDVEQVRAVAEAFPEASVVLAGQCPDPDHYKALDLTLNVSLRPPVPRGQLPGLVAAADVGLIPHSRTPLTEAMSPLKLYEYLAAGLPVAAADLPGVTGVWPERCELAEGARDFPAAVERALALGRAAPGERRAFIAQNGWNSRFERLLHVALAD